MRPGHTALTGRWAVAAVAASLAVVGAPVTADAGVPAPRAPIACDQPATPGGTVTPVPWAQQLLAPQRVQQLSTGAGITVAVLDSGVDDSHPQLAGQVLAGYDFLRNTAGGNVDCASHGTAVASLIAAQRVSGIGFQGLAPGVRILPVRVSEHEDSDSGQGGSGQGDSVSPDVFGQAIRYAADNGARIINISLTLDTDYPAVASAVSYAQGKGCLIVAAVGNHHTDQQDSSAAPSLGANDPATVDPPSYPAAYSGVLGVGAINADGTRLSQSQVGPYVDLVAPGGDVLAATRVSGYATWSGTSFAAPLVSAAAALVWSASPQLSNTDVAHRLEATADPMPKSGSTNEFGHGLVDPYRAVTELLPPSAAASAGAALPGAALDPATAARNAAWHTDGRIAIAVGLLVATLVLTAWLLSLAVRRGRAREWRPGVPPAPAPHATVDEPEQVFFALPGRNPTD